PLVHCPDQPASLRSRAAVVRGEYPRRLVLPELLAQSLPGQAGLPPGLLGEQRAVPDQVVGPAGALGILPGEAPPRAGAPAGAAVALVGGQPGEAQPVGLGTLDLLQGDLPLGPVVHLVGDAGLRAALAV